MSAKDGYDTLTFPVLRRLTNYKKIANDLIGIQPMTLPTGNIFYMDYTYGEDAVSVPLEKTDNVRETLIKLIRSHKAETIRTVITKSFPQHLDLFEKLIILK